MSDLWPNQFVGQFITVLSTPPSPSSMVSEQKSYMVGLIYGEPCIIFCFFKLSKLKKKCYYSRVHISLDTAFLKILKKLSTVQE